MSKGVGRLPEKERRKMRRRNHFARDLWKPEFRQRRVEVKKKKSTPGTRDWYTELDEDDDELE